MNRLELRILQPLPDKTYIAIFSSSSSGLSWPSAFILLNPGALVIDVVQLNTKVTDRL